MKLKPLRSHTTGHPWGTGMCRSPSASCLALRKALASRMCRWYREYFGAVLHVCVDWYDLEGLEISSGISMTVVGATV